jgi:hypothetical protein
MRNSSAISEVTTAEMFDSVLAALGNHCLEFGVSATDALPLPKHICVYATDGSGVSNSDRCIHHQHAFPCMHSSLGRPCRTNCCLSSSNSSSIAVRSWAQLVRGTAKSAARCQQHRQDARTDTHAHAATHARTGARVPRTGPCSRRTLCRPAPGGIQVTIF